MVHSGSKTALASEGLGVYRLALEESIGEVESARFRLESAGPGVIAFDPAGRIAFAFVTRTSDAGLPADRFLFVETALALSRHFGTLVVPGQAGVQPFFTHAAPYATIHGYRFAVSGSAEKPG